MSTDASEGPPPQHIGVSLSGGGHRATLFGLGSMAYLLDARKGPELATISSISGGSITNGWLGLEADLSVARPDQVDDLTRRLATHISGSGTLWASSLTYVYLLALLAVPGTAVVATIAWDGLSVWLSWLVAVLLVAVLTQRRSWIARHSFDRSLFHGKPLTDMQQAVVHCIGATDLQTSEQVYFSSRFVYSWRTGVGQPSDVKVAAAVQASACLPGAFNPVSFPLAQHRFPKTSGLRSFLLADGGVYDNMGSEWLLRAATGFDEGGDGIDLAPVDEVVVVNSSAAKSVVSRRFARIPGIGEIVSLLAVKDVMYDQTTALRRRWLDTRYRIAARANDRLPALALRGATIQIDRSPYDLPDAYKEFDDRQGRAAATVITMLDRCDGREYWRDEANKNRQVGTTLSKVPTDRAAGLLRHAYVLTMANCHVVFGYPLLEVPSLERARSWVS